MLYTLCKDWLYIQNKLLMFEYHLSTACPLTNCTKRSKCEIDEQTGEAYCRRSCDIENGGCEHRLCITEERSCVQEQCER